ncbi:MAG: hypothetical protein AAF728_14805 [Cyanobacteria bacterium P01_D01_bin.128]
MIDDISQTLTAISTLGTQAEQAMRKVAQDAGASIGQTLEPIAQNPGVKAVAKVPGMNWLLLWLGQVDIAATRAAVETARRSHPAEDKDAIAERIIQEMTWQAARLGLLTNIVPPIALALLAVDIVGLTRLQAEMVYQLAAVYGLDLESAERRGEAVMLYGLAFAGGTPTKFALSWLELIPVVGAATGASSNAALIYLLGQTARHYYSNRSD